MKHEVKAISLTCDGCGQTFETLDGMVCYADDQDGKLVEETARNSDWKMMNGHHTAPAAGSAAMTTSSTPRTASGGMIQALRW